MKKFLISLYIFIQLYRMGYIWSGLFQQGWGFYRLNYLKGDVKEYSLLDVDFSTRKDHPYSHVHGGKSNFTIFRVDEGKITVSSKIPFGMEKSHETKDIQDSGNLDLDPGFD